MLEDPGEQLRSLTEVQEEAARHRKMNPGKMEKVVPGMCVVYTVEARLFRPALQAEGLRRWQSDKCFPGRSDNSSSLPSSRDRPSFALEMAAGLHRGRCVDSGFGGLFPLQKQFRLE